MFTLNCKGKIVVLDKPVVMGILNITPDSFYTGLLLESMDAIVDLTGKMIADGADIIDIGGQSTRPGSNRIGASEETDRVIPVIENIHKHFPDTIISIDTYHSQVATTAINLGASIVNDISAGNMDKNMIETVAGLKVPYVIMHMKGTPENMQKNPLYENITREVLDFFVEKKDECFKAGIKDIIIDPGFGFGKSIQHNYTILRNLDVYKILDLPLLAGLSRKSMIYKPLHSTPEEALNGTTALNMLALNNGASILRVHDVKEAKETTRLFLEYKNAVQNLNGIHY